MKHAREDIDHKLPISGIEMIKNERQEQIEKHGFNAEHDDREDNKHGELAQAAACLLSMDFAEWRGESIWVDYPDSWSSEHEDRFRKKNKIDRLVIAGALIAAEIDRLVKIKERAAGVTVED